MVQHNLSPASRALDILLDPSPQAGQVEDVTTSQLFRQHHLFEADDAGGIDADSVCGLFEVHIWKPLQLVDEGPGLDEELHRFVELDERVNALTQKVQGKLATHEDPQEELSIEQ